MATDRSVMYLKSSIPLKNHSIRRKLNRILKAPQKRNDLYCKNLGMKKSGIYAKRTTAVKTAFRAKRLEKVFDSEESSPFEFAISRIPTNDIPIDENNK